MIWRAAQCAAIILWAGNAHAETFCAEMQDGASQNTHVQMTLPVTGQTTDCTRSLMLSGGVQLHCGWAFAYRAPAAAAAFESLVATVSNCLGEGAAVTADLNVNHPDYYDLQTFELGGREVGVSLKDKGALSQTYVFLRMTLPK